MISAEQIAAIDKAIVFLTHDNPGCRLHVELEEIVVDTEAGDVLVYDVNREAYKTEYCEQCGEAFAPAEMSPNGDNCIFCQEDNEE